MNIRKSVLDYNHYYFEHDNLRIWDKEIAEKLNISTEEFRELITERFNAKLQPRKDMLMFISKSDAESALDYINSLLLFKKITLN